MPAAVPVLMIPLALGRSAAPMRLATAVANGGEARPVLSPASAMPRPSVHPEDAIATKPIPAVAASPAASATARGPSRPLQ